MKKICSPLALAVVAIVSHPGNVFGQQISRPPVPTVPEPLPISGPAPGGAVTTSQTVSPGTSSRNTLSGSVQVEGTFQGSTPIGMTSPEPLALNLREAVRRGLAYNLGVIDATATERARRRNLLLLPNRTTSPAWMRTIWPSLRRREPSAIPNKAFPT